MGGIALCFLCFVVCPPGALDDTTVRSLLRGVLAGYKIPKRVHFVDALPRDPFQGKGRRTELRRIAEELGRSSAGR